MVDWSSGGKTREFHQAWTHPSGCHPEGWGTPPPRGHPAGGPKDAMQLAWKKWQRHQHLQGCRFEKGAELQGKAPPGTSSVPVPPAPVLSRSTTWRAEYHICKHCHGSHATDFYPMGQQKERALIFSALIILSESHSRNRKLHQDTSFQCAENANTSMPQLFYTSCLKHSWSSGNSTWDFWM